MMSKKLTLLALFCIFLLPTSSALETNVTATGLDVAVSVLPFMDELRQEDGTFYYSKLCNQDGCKIYGPSVQQNNAWTALAYISLFNATGDSQYLTLASQEMDKLLIECDPADIECSFVGVQAVMVYQATKDERYLKYLDELKPELNIRESTMLYGILGREMALSYSLGYEDDRTDALNTLLAGQELSEKEQVLFKTPTGKVRDGMCWVTLGWIEFYRALERNPESTFNVGASLELPNSKMRKEGLRYAQFFYDDVDFSTVDGDDIDFYETGLVELQPCVESLLILNEITGKEKYREDALYLLQLMVDQYWDSPLAMHFNGDGGFNAQGCRRGSNETYCYNNMKYLNDNAYAVYLYSLVKDEEFTVQVDKQTRVYDDPIEDPYYVPKEAESDNTLALLFSGVIALVILIYVLFTSKRK